MTIEEEKKQQLNALMAELPTVPGQPTVDLNRVTRDQQQRWGAIVRGGVHWRATKEAYSRDACYSYKSARLYFKCAWSNGDSLISDYIEMIVTPGWREVRPPHRAVLIDRLHRAGGTDMEYNTFGPWYDCCVLKWDIVCPHIRDYDAEARDVMLRALAEIKALGFDVESTSNTDHPDVLAVDNLYFVKRHKTADEKREAAIDVSPSVKEEDEDADLERTLYPEGLP